MKVSPVQKGFTLVEIMIVVAIIGIIIAIAVPAFLRARENARGRACQENLTKIDGAKEQYAIEKKQPAGGAAAFDVLVTGVTGYLKSTPTCPAGGTYTPAVIGTDPTCTYETTRKAQAIWAVPHVMPGTGADATVADD